MPLSFKQSIHLKESVAYTSRTLSKIYCFAARNDVPFVSGLIVLIVALTSIAAAMKGQYFIDGHHPGNMLNGALNILHGEPLLSHVQSIYGLFLPYMNAIQLYLFGEFYLSLWVLPIIGFSGGLAIYYKLFKGFLGSLESLVAVFIILALNATVLLPWSNYMVFGTNALLVLLFSRVIEQPGRQRLALIGVGALLFLSALIRTQAILLFPGLLAIIYYYSKEKWFSKAAALSFGLVCPIAIFVSWLAYEGTLKDYYLQTTAIQDQLYFGEKGPLLGLSQVFEVFTTGHAQGKPILSVGFPPFNYLFGGLWLALFIPSAYVVLRFCLALVSGPATAAQRRFEVPPSVLSIAMLTAIGPSFAIHNVWDNFRYALGMAQGIGIVFYCITRVTGRENSRAAVLTVSLFFITPLYALVQMANTSVGYLTAKVMHPTPVSHPKYFENINVAPWLRERLLFAERFFQAYYKQYPDSYVYTTAGTITDGIYAIGKFRTFHKTLSNDHFAGTYPKFYPEYAAKFDEAARSRKLIFLTNDGNYRGLEKYGYVKFREGEDKGLVIFIAKERADTVSMP